MTSRVLVISAWVAFGLLGVGLEAAARRPGSRWLPVTALLRPALTGRPARLAILLVWWWIGWHFLVEP